MIPIPFFRLLTSGPDGSDELWMEGERICVSLHLHLVTPATLFIRKEIILPEPRYFVTKFHEQRRANAYYNNVWQRVPDMSSADIIPSVSFVTPLDITPEPLMAEQRPVAPT